jgi:hypothetical protein
LSTLPVYRKLLSCQKPFARDIMGRQGGSIMLEKIETKEILTLREAHKKYETKFFVMVFTEIVDQGDNDRGYVIYAADDERELAKIPQSEYDYGDTIVGFMMGGLAYPYPMIERIVHYG